MDIKQKSQALLADLRTELANADSEFLAKVWRECVESMELADTIIQSGNYFDACDLLAGTEQGVKCFGVAYRKGLDSRLERLWNACLNA